MIYHFYWIPRGSLFGVDVSDDYVLVCHYYSTRRTVYNRHLLFSNSDMNRTSTNFNLPAENDMCFHIHFYRKHGYAFVCTEHLPK